MYSLNTNIICLLCSVLDESNVGEVKVIMPLLHRYLDDFFSNVGYFCQSRTLHLFRLFTQKKYLVLYLLIKLD